MPIKNVLVVDEPMVGLDPRAAKTLKELFRQYTNRGHTIMMSTHTLEIAEGMCDRVGIMQRGKLVACGTMDQLRSGNGEASDAALEDIFLRLTGESVARELIEVLNV